MPSDIRSSPSARGDIAQSHGCRQCIAEPRRSMRTRNETGESDDQSIRFPRHRLPRNLLTPAYAALSLPCYYYLTPPGQLSRALLGMAHGTANDWCADGPLGGVHALMTGGIARLLPLLPWICFHEANVAPHDDLSRATVRLTASPCRISHGIAPRLQPKCGGGGRDLAVLLRIAQR